VRAAVFSLPHSRCRCCRPPTPPQTPPYPPNQRLGGLNGTFFQQGWGDLSCVNLREDLEIIATWPPPQPLGVEWKLLERGTWRGTPFRHFEGTFRCVCMGGGGKGGEDEGLFAQQRPQPPSSPPLTPSPPSPKPSQTIPNHPKPSQTIPHQNAVRGARVQCPPTREPPGPCAAGDSRWPHGRGVPPSGNGRSGLEQAAAAGVAADAAGEGSACGVAWRGVAEVG
jgi:hypothetical protein